MSEVKIRAIDSGDDGLRLDRWFKKHYPSLSHGQLQKLLRTGQIRVDGKRVKANLKICEQQSVRVPPIAVHASDKSPGGQHKNVSRKQSVNPETIKDLKSRILFRNAEILILDKPAGLAVQGGSRTPVHLDGMLDELRFDADERPRLVHRLDKDTSGVLVLGRTAKATRWLTAQFKHRETRKLYWALVAGMPKLSSGQIRLPLAKLPGKGGEKMTASETGKYAETNYRILDHAGRNTAWLAMEPMTGRTHQLRAHAAIALETPIIGDGKYGGTTAFVDGIPEKSLQLHARALLIPMPNGGPIVVEAPLPRHMEENFQFFGFHPTPENSDFMENLG